jgi:hypothetical protein
MGHVHPLLQLMHTSHIEWQPLTSSVQEYVVRLWVLTLLKTWSYHPPLCKPQSSKQGLCFIFLYSVAYRGKRGGLGGSDPPPPRNSTVLTKLSRNSLKVPNIKKLLLHEMKFLVRNYICLQNPWLGRYCPQIPVLSGLIWISCTPPPKQNSWVCHCLYSRHKRAAETDNNFTRVPLCKWRWWYKSKFCVCTFERWQSKVS